jgi:hypothetical protein
MDTRVGALLLLAVAACSNGGTAATQPGNSYLDQTGLEGSIREGPTQPVCSVDKPCDAAVQAGFTLEREGVEMARFETDPAGHFVVYVEPGAYLLVPDQPIGISPQTTELIVGTVGLTHVEVMFDTGIR